MGINITRYSNFTMLSLWVTMLFSLLFIVGYWAVPNSLTTKHYCCVNKRILILDSCLISALTLLLLWCGRVIKVDSGRVRKEARALRGKRSSERFWRERGGEKFVQRGARAPRPSCAHNARAPIPQAPETRARALADMKRPCEDTTSDSDMDETIDVGSENNYPA